MARRGRRNGAQGEFEVRCRCKSHCTTYNPDKGRFEGNGFLVSYGTLTRHRRDDRLRSLLRLPPQHHTPPDDETNNQGWIPLIQTEVAVLEEIPVVLSNQTLQFHDNPALVGGVYHRDWPDNRALRIALPNTGRHALKVGDGSNAAYLQCENRLWELFQLLDNFERRGEVTALQGRIYRRLQALDRQKEGQWKLQSGAIQTRTHVDMDLFFQRSIPMSPKAQVASLASILLHSVHFSSRRTVEVQLGAFADILQEENFSGSGRRLVPKTPRTLNSRFRLDPITKTYIACTKCHCLYTYHSLLHALHQHSIGQLSTCTFKSAPESPPCGHPLWKTVDAGPAGMIDLPQRKYVHQDLKTWLGRMLSRSTIEEILDKGIEPQDGGVVGDIWQGRIFPRLKDSSGNPFYPGPGSELRLVFSLSVDSFDTFGGKIAKQKASSTGIWMVLLNLPPQLRYLPQNMYTAGVIPGPSKPSTDEINHYLSLVVGDLKDFWGPGVFYSRTSRHPGGRHTRAMLVPLVCDLLGARQVIGYAGVPTAHYCCTACDIDIDDINLLEPSLWPRKDLSDCRYFAQLHRDAPSTSLKDKYFEASGWRWSPLWELPYWNPIAFTVIDSMHALDLNLIKNHIRTILQIDFKRPGGEGLREAHSKKRDRVINDKDELLKLRQCQDIIFSNPPTLPTDLIAFHRRILYTFCLDYEIKSAGSPIVCGTRWVLAKNITFWRRSSTEAQPTLLTFIHRYPRLSEVQESLEISEATIEANPPNSTGEGGSSSNPAAGPGPGSTGTDERVPKLPKPSVMQAMAERLIALEELDSSEAEALVQRVTLPTWMHYCDLLNLPRDAGSIGARPTKRRLMKIIWDHLQESDYNRDVLLGSFEVEEPPAPHPSAAFLGKDIMEAVWSDMKRTRLPSWVTPVPTDWGTVGRGKLSADNWRVLFCVHLPITLIRIFGGSSGRRKKILDNLMDLVQAIRIATLDVSSEEQIEQYEHYIFKYSRGVRDLFPDYNILPAHHAALHLGEMLRNFGPKHGHDSPHYERFIRFFRRMGTNNKIGDLEGTLLRTSTRCANALALVQDYKLTEDVRNMMERMGTITRERYRGFRIAEVLDFSAEHPDWETEANAKHGALSEEQFELLCDHVRQLPTERNTEVSRNVLFLDGISKGISIYATWDSRRHRDSGILFQRDGEKVAGLIQTIFRHQHIDSLGIRSENVFLIVGSYRKLEVESRTYRQYGTAGGFCCEFVDADSLPQILISVDDIVCPIVITTFDNLPSKFIHVLPINRTRARHREFMEMSYPTSITAEIDPRSSQNFVIEVHIPSILENAVPSIGLVHSDAEDTRSETSLGAESDSSYQTVPESDEDMNTSERSDLGFEGNNSGFGNISNLAEAGSFTSWVDDSAVQRILAEEDILMSISLVNLKPFAHGRRRPRYDARELHRLASICKAWRTVILGCPAFWGGALNIDKDCLEAFQTYMERSKPGEFHLFSLKPTADPAQLHKWRVALGNFDRCAGFYFEYRTAGPGANDARPLSLILKSPAPHLTSLIVVETTISLRRMAPFRPTLPSNLTPPNPQSLLSSEAPRLKTCILFGPLCHLGGMVSSSFGGITSLAVQNCRDDIAFISPSQNIYHWIVTIRNLPRLRILQLVHAIYIPKHIPSESCSECDDLSENIGDPPTLQYLRLVGNDVIYSRLFSLVHLGPDSRYDIDLAIEASPIPLVTDADSSVLSKLESSMRFVRSLHTLISGYADANFSQCDLAIESASLRLSFKGQDLGSSTCIRVQDRVLSHSDISTVFGTFIQRMGHPSEIPSICNLSVTLGTLTTAVPLHAPLQHLFSKMIGVNQLSLNSTALQELNFPVLQDHFTVHYSPDYSQSFPLLPGLRRIFVDLGSVESRAVWGHLEAFLQWRLDKSRGGVYTVFVVGRDDDTNRALLASVVSSNPTSLVEADISFSLIRHLERAPLGPSFVPWLREKKFYFRYDPAYTAR